MRLDPGIVKEADCRGWLGYHLFDVRRYRERPPKDERHVGEDRGLTASMKKRKRKQTSPGRRLMCR